MDTLSIPGDDRDDTANSDRLVSAVGDIETTTLARSGEPIDVAERLAKTGIDVTVLVDAAMEGIIASGAVDTVLL